MNNTISAILPIHQLDETTKQLTINAIESVKQQTYQPNELIIVVPVNNDFNEFLKSIDFGKLNVRIIENDGETDFSSQINLGVKESSSEWVSFLEYDDEYSKIWFKNANEYINSYKDVEMFLPLVVDVDPNGYFIGLTNEAVLAHGFSDELMVLDNNSLLMYQNFNPDGMVVKKDTFLEYGGFKSKIKLMFLYEFLLRMSFNSVKIMTIPKYGYKHVNQREGSLFNTYKKEINPVDAKWWLSIAKKEYFYKNDREITEKV